MGQEVGYAADSSRRGSAADRGSDGPGGRASGFGRRHRHRPSALARAMEPLRRPGLPPQVVPE